MIIGDISNYTSIKLKDGRTGCIVEVYSKDKYGTDCTGYEVDINKGYESWETITVLQDDILEIIRN